MFDAGASTEDDADVDPATRTEADPIAEARNYINRELSQLEFNRRVLEQARDEATPLLERLRFLTICSTNLDEFFEIRVAGLKQQVALGITQVGPDGLTPQETLDRIYATAQGIVAEQYALLNDVLLPALEDRGIRVLKRELWTPRLREWVHDYFQRQVFPVLTPLGLDPSHPFPRVLNKGLCFMVSLEGEDAFHRTGGMAVVQVPRSLPRLIQADPGASGGPYDYVLLSSVIHAHVGALFAGMRITGCFQFRLTRNSDLWVDEEEIDDLLHALKGELPARKYGEAVRLETPVTCSEAVLDSLLEQFGLGEQDLYRVDGPVNLHRLQALHSLVDRPDLKYPPFLPGLPRRLRHEPDMFETLRQGDVLLHHPYESFTPILDLIRQAARDPQVLAIKMTVYRTGTGSPVSDVLVDAARAGKEVTTVVELRARFDEAANIDLATRLQEAGANVVYGIVGYKTHAKLLMVVRREPGGLRRYCHVGTGNYHPGTARAYTDLGYLTADEEIGEDVHAVFQQLTGLGTNPALKRLLQAPFTLHDTLLRHVEREAEAARAGRKARIIARMNSLSEPRIIQALYRASQAGVPIDLVVRGICCLRPGVPDLSDNIRVRSIVGRFLEHSRLFYFHDEGRETTIMASADWMNRNFFRRVETALPIRVDKIRVKAVRDALWSYLEDNVQAWELRANGSYARIARDEDEVPVVAQDVLLERLSSRREARSDSLPRPRRP